MPAEIVILTNQRLSLSTWNQAIEAQDYLAPVVLADDQPDAGEGRWHARLDGRVISCLIRKVPVARLAAAGPGPNGSPWLYAFAATDEIDMARMAVAVAAVLAYAVATGGVVYDQEERVVRNAAELKPFADMLLGAMTGRNSMFNRRYGINDTPPVGPSFIGSYLLKD